MTSLKTQAIQTALLGNWNQAISLNESLIQEDPDNIDTLNRLAYAYAAAGKTKEAKNIYQKVLQLDYKNPIALKNMKRLTGGFGKKTENKNAPAAPLVNTLFLEEPGKTKIIELVNVAEQKQLALLTPGEPVNIRVKRSKVFILDNSEQYIGVLPDNIGKRLLIFLKGGNTYEGYIKSAQNNHVSIFIKEVKRVNRFKNQPTFIFLEKGKQKAEKPIKGIREKTKETQDIEEEESSEEES